MRILLHLGAYFCILLLFNLEKKGHQQQRIGIDQAFQKHPDEEEYARVESFWQIDKQHALIKYQRGLYSITMKTVKQCRLERKDIIEFMQRREKEDEILVEEGNVRKSNWLSACTNCVHVDDQPIMASVKCDDDLMNIGGIKIKKESTQGNAKCMASRISGDLQLKGHVFLHGGYLYFNLETYSEKSEQLENNQETNMEEEEMQVLTAEEHGHIKNQKEVDHVTKVQVEHEQPTAAAEVFNNESTADEGGHGSVNAKKPLVIRQGLLPLPPGRQSPPNSGPIRNGNVQKDHEKPLGNGDVPQLGDNVPKQTLTEQLKTKQEHRDLLYRIQLDKAACAKNHFNFICSTTQRTEPYSFDKLSAAETAYKSFDTTD